jgi:hypothetical protein
MFGLNTPKLIWPFVPGKAASTILGGSATYTTTTADINANIANIARRIGVLLSKLGLATAKPLSTLPCQARDCVQQSFPNGRLLSQEWRAG